MTMDIGTWSGVRGECIENCVNTGGATMMRLLTSLGISPSESGELELDTFIVKLREAMDGWGPGAPGYPDMQYVRDYGRGPDYIAYWHDELLEMVGKGRDQGHRFVVWF